MALRMLDQLDLRDPEYASQINQNPRYSCGERKLHHECASCHADKLKEFFTPEIQFAISANQFSPQFLAEKNNRIAQELADKSPNFLTEITRIFISTIANNSEALANFEHKKILEQVLIFFKKNKANYAAWAERFNISLEEMVNDVLPTVLSIQAHQFLQVQGKELIERYPLFKKILFEANVLFRESPYDSKVRFFDEMFPTYDANRVMRSERSKLCRLAGPSDNDDVATMFENTVFNDKYPIEDLIVVADHFKEDESFTPYWQLENYFLFPEGTQKLFGKRDANLPLEAKNAKFEVLVSNVKESSAKTSATIKLQIRNLQDNRVKTLTVDYFRIKDCLLIPLSNPQDFERFYDAYKKFEKNEVPLGVQASIIGLGGNGMVIFSFMLAKYFKDFGKEISFDQIHDVAGFIVKQLRSYNPSLLRNNQQYLFGIKLACFIYSHSRTLSRSLEDVTQSFPPSNTAPLNVLSIWKTVPQPDGKTPFFKAKPPLAPQPPHFLRTLAIQNNARKIAERFSQTPAQKTEWFSEGAGPGPGTVIHDYASVKSNSR